jgi:hypothetical protein
MDPELLQVSNGNPINGQREVGELIREAAGARAESQPGCRRCPRLWRLNVDQARRAQRSVVLPLVLWSVKTPEASTTV